MPGNHLVIGLGGTGGRIIRDIRKTLATLDDRVGDAAFEFVYVDSDKSYVDPEKPHPEWRILGRNISLSQDDYVLIGGVDLRPVVDNPTGYPSFKKILGDPLSMKRFLDSSATVVAGAQRRRYGRLLFANKAKEIKHALTRKKAALQKPGRMSDLTVHICAGLAGGTGSGAIVDCVAMVRKYIATNPPRDRVILYLLLPEESSPWENDSKMYHANGYAALAELNALSLGRLNPANSLESGAAYDVTDPFDIAFLINNINSQGRVSDASKGLPQIVSDFIVHRSITQASEELLRVERSENTAWKPEPSIDDATVPDRTKKFAVFGIERLTVPEQETDEYLTYYAAKSIAAQVLTSNWRDGEGFVLDRRNIDFAARVREAANLGSWRLADNFLTLSSAILPTDDKNAAGKSIWTDFATTWSNAAAGIKGHVLENAAIPSDSKISALQAELSKIALSGFRLEGITNFFSQKLQAAPLMAKHIRQILEKHLLEEWRGGLLGLNDVHSYITAIIAYVETRLQAAPGKAAEFDDAATKSQAGVAELISVLANKNFISRGINRTRYLESAQQLLVAHFTQRTSAEGWRFAKSLLTIVFRELNSLLESASTLAAQTTKMAEEFERQGKSRLQADDANSHAMRLFDKNGVDRLRDTFITDRGSQSSGANALKKTLGPDNENKNSFEAIGRAFDPSAMRDAFEQQAETSTKNWLEKLSADERSSVVGNIVDKLSREYGASDDALSQFCRSVVVKAAAYGNFDPNEEILDYLGVAPDRIPKKRTALFWVPSPENSSKSFFDKLCKNLSDHADADVKLPATVEGVPKNEIVIATIVNVFPLRFLKEFRMLRDKYDVAVRQNPAVKYFAWCEDDQLDVKCPLFIPVGGVSGRMLTLQYVLVGLAMGVIRQKDPTFQSACFVEFTDEDGMPQRKVVASSGAELLQDLRPENDGIVKKEVGSALNKLLAQPSPDRETVFSRMRDIVLARLNEELAGNTEHEEYRRLLQGMKLAKTSLLKL